MAEAPVTAPEAAAPAADADRVHFTLDGRPATARRGELIISAAERAGVFVPRFCYHPRMSPVGVCRMCLVEVSGPRGATLQPACFVAVEEGAEVVTASAKVKKAQDGVLEFLLVNHPLDCPVCDKGGECPLQDQTLAYGPGESRFTEEKRHFEKPIPISALVLLDRERCIQCARCTRFAEEVAGEALIDFSGRGEMVEVATFPDRPFSSYFSGNTVQICPVGALTATPYRFRARPWDLDQVESTCTTCALGCRVAAQSSGNRLTRLLGIDADPVNQGWLCDKGRFVTESVNGGGEGPADAAHPGPARITEPLVRVGGELVTVSWAEALRVAATGLDQARAGGAAAVGVLGGAQLTNEGAYAWAKLAKGVIGTDSVDAQLGDGLPADLILSLPRATIDEACAARVVVLLTGDVREELPVLFLRLRQSALAGTTSLIELAPTSTSLTSYAAASLPLRPGDAPAVARALVGGDEQVAGPSHPEGPAWSAAALESARALLAGAGPAGQGVVVLVGRASVAEDAAVTAAAVRVLADALPAARFLPTLRRSNVQGALDMGLGPGVLPGRVSLSSGRAWFLEHWGSVPEARGRDAAAMLTSAARGASAGGVATRALIILGADPLADFPDRRLAEAALRAAELVIVVGGHHTEICEHADVVLPAAVAHERAGSTTNIEGRVSRLGHKLVAPGSAWPDWMIAQALAEALGEDLGFASADGVWEEIEQLGSVHRGVTPAVLESAGAHDGVVVPLQPDRARRVAPIDPIATPGVDSVERQGAPPRVGVTEADEWPEAPAAGAAPPPVLAAPAAADPPEVPLPDSYSLRLVSARRLYDGGTAVSGSPSLAPLVPAAVARANPYDLDRLGLVAGDQATVRGERASARLPVAPDRGVPRGVLVVDFNLPGGGLANVAAALIDAGALVNDVRLESL
ncbi:MAG TPA: NADH-quinone oxidoreductase subunit NuoG [Acidimicrobiales bacterium]|nr:NADH-quinone oxidoreductase subunit NuoG [Acidimicrobiales bacterium]